MVKVSIITVCFNDCDKLKRTAASIQIQEFNDFEWVVIDGGSKDGTLDYLKESSLVTRYISEQDTGIYDAMNKGINISIGDYCLFLNAGDYFYNSHSLTVTSKWLNEDIVIGWLKVIYPDSWDKISTIKKLDAQDIREKFLYHKALPHQSSFIRRDLFRQYGLYDPSFRICGDRDFFNRVLTKHAGISFIPYCIAVFSMDGISSTMMGSKIYTHEINRCRERNFTKWYRVKRAIVDPIEKLLNINRL